MEIFWPVWKMTSIEIAKNGPYNKCELRTVAHSVVCAAIFDVGFVYSFFHSRIKCQCYYYVECIRMQFSVFALHLIVIRTKLVSDVFWSRAVKHIIASDVSVTRHQYSTDMGVCAVCALHYRVFRLRWAKVSQLILSPSMHSAINKLNELARERVQNQKYKNTTRNRKRYMHKRRKQIYTQIQSCLHTHAKWPFTNSFSVCSVLYLL